MRFRALVLAALLLLPVGARAAAPLWRVHGPKGEVILFGSFHLLPPGVEWRPPELDAALVQAHELCFEVAMDEASQARAAELFRRSALLPKGTHLASQLPPDLYARLLRDARALDVDAGVLDGLKPWAADLVLTDAVASKAGATPETGVEHELDLITPASVKRCALESVDSQIALLASLESGENIAELGVSLDDAEKGPALFRLMIAAYAKGDLPTLAESTTLELKARAPRTYEKLFVARNLRFAGEVEARLRRPGLSVVVVGEGHMLGPDGVPALLRARGYSVEGPAAGSAPEARAGKAD